ncbi:MAG: hypothetical protein KKH41_05945 [Candidatus Thermoplasmatota archaeon]|nr:hypothetical protein [Euryarchaeota archaeon]MBU4032556.1 hypothetical protein [Candidatus Thermoplasmatota archaeon]MBU4072029.1 hypothetical protein [Candidatus Thermoplasmatota archaeon]MBU4144560.1 hypothetical protein [Candidatus Thermoplasmatota archaeon]MBU4592109.1 hypothetical protein [Candidatus Thermoplasmatota archaeon]
MIEPKRLNLVLGAIAVAILLLSFTAYAYTLIPQGDPDVLVVNGIEYDWDAIFSDFEMLSFEANGEQYEGISLEALILDAGIENPETHGYRFNALDPYEKDVTWNDILNGYLIETEHRSVFPKLTQSFWVRDLASIEVI